MALMPGVNPNPISSKERKVAIRMAFTLAKDWIGFARAKSHYLVGLPELEQSMFLAAIVDNLMLAEAYRSAGKSLQRERQ